MMRAAVCGRCAWRELTNEAASLTQQPAPTVIHFARFEQPFLRMLAAGVFPLDVVCTRDIARRLLPDLPRCSLRALAGYFGAFTLSSFDRLRVLTTELKRLIAARAPVALRLGVGPALDESRLASGLWWV